MSMYIYECPHIYSYTQRYDNIMCSAVDVLSSWTGPQESVTHAVSCPSSICSGVLVAIPGGYLRLWGISGVWLAALPVHLHQEVTCPGCFQCLLVLWEVLKKSEKHHWCGTIDLSLRGHESSPGSWYKPGFWAKNPWRVERESVPLL